MAWDKPVGFKIVISGRVNIEPFARIIASLPKDKGPDFITVDGWDGWSATAPIALWILFGKKIYEALAIVNGVLEEYGVRDRVKVFASSKLYAPHMSARALSSGADAIGNARSIMIAGWCIRAWLCSGEFGVCPVGMATMKKWKRRGYEQVRAEKVDQIANYIKAHNKWLIQVAAVAWVKSPHELSSDHMVIQRYARQEDAADEKKRSMNK
jgi:glutamate synthase domain-containing protein 2